MTGTRKATQTFKAQVILLLGYAIAALADAPAEVFWVFVLGVTGNLGAFVWGNVKVHQAQGRDNGPTATRQEIT